MRAFFQELKTNGRRRTAPQRGGAARSGFDVRRPRWDDPVVLTISGHHQSPAAAPSLCSHSRAPPPTTGAGPAARGTRTQDPGPTNSNDHDPTRTKTFARNTASTPDPTAPTPRPRSASTIDHTTSATTSRCEARPHDGQARPPPPTPGRGTENTPRHTTHRNQLLHTSRTTGSGGGCTTCWRSVLCLGLARFDRGVHRDAVARVVAGESAAAVARDVGCRRGTVSQWCRDAEWSWSGGVRAGLLRLTRPDAPESSRPSWVGGVNRTEFDGVVMRGEGITAVGLKEVLVGAAGAGHEDGRWRRWSPRVGPRGAIRRIAREQGASWGSAHLGAPGPGPDQGARPGTTRWRGRRADQGV